MDRNTNELSTFRYYKNLLTGFVINSIVIIDRLTKMNNFFLKILTSKPKQYPNYEMNNILYLLIFALIRIDILKKYFINAIRPIDI